MTLSGRILLWTKCEAWMKKTDLDNIEAKVKRSLRGAVRGGVSRISRKLRGLWRWSGTLKTKSNPTKALAES